MFEVYMYIGACSLVIHQLAYRLCFVSNMRFNRLFLKAAEVACRMIDEDVMYSKPPTRKYLVYRLLMAKFGIKASFCSTRLWIRWILLDYHFNNDFPPVDFSLSRFEVLRKKGYPFVEKTMTNKMVQENWKKGGYSPYRRLLGYIFILGTIGFCGYVFLLYSLQFSLDSDPETTRAVWLEQCWMGLAADMSVIAVLILLQWVVASLMWSSVKPADPKKILNTRLTCDKASRKVYRHEIGETGEELEMVKIEVPPEKPKVPRTKSKNMIKKPLIEKEKSVSVSEGPPLGTPEDSSDSEAPHTGPALVVIAKNKWLARNKNQMSFEKGDTIEVVEPLGKKPNNTHKSHNSHDP